MQIDNTFPLSYLLSPAKFFFATKKPALFRTGDMLIAFTPPLPCSLDPQAFRLKNFLNRSGDHAIGKNQKHTDQKQCHAIRIMAGLKTR
ncbi:MAG: hypothetical protein V2G48_05040 [bacterium JZ-2024 1]